MIRYLLSELGCLLFRKFPHDIDGAILYAAHYGNIECLKPLIAKRDPCWFGSRVSGVGNIPLFPSFPLSGCAQGVFKNWFRDFCLGTQTGADFWRAEGSAWIQRSDDVMLERLPGERCPTTPAVL